MAKEVTIICYTTFISVIQDYQRKASIFVKGFAKNELMSISGTLKR